MRFILLVSLIIFSFFTANAQIPASRDTSGSRKSGRDTAAFNNMPAIGKVMGILKDSTTKETMEFASVALIRIKDSTAVGGSLSNQKGQFLIEEIKPGRYIIRITSIGFRTLDSKPFMLTPKDPQKDFGVVYMFESNKNLKEVKIEGEKVQYVNSLDKKVYNVEKDVVSTGGTAADVMKNVPSVNVDVDGKVSLRGSENVTILIDGKPTSIGGGNTATLLQQLPAGSIQSVEVITNPSARYDAEGMAGIINIITKKDRNSGLNGTVSGGAGTGDKYNAGFTLNNRTKKVNLFTQYNLRIDNRPFSGSSDRLNLYSTPNTIYTTANNGTTHSESNNFRLGADFFLSQYSTLSATAGISTRFETQNQQIDYSFQTDEGVPYEEFYRKISSNEHGQNVDGVLDYKYSFPGSKKELTASASYGQNNRPETESYTDYYPDSTGSSNRNETTGIFSTGVFQADYVQPINDRSKFEAGIKGSGRSNDNDVVGLVSQDGEVYYVDSNYTNHFIYTERILAGYSQYTGNFKMFDYMVGLRAEETHVIGDTQYDSTVVSSDFTNDYFNLFPSATIKYTLKEVNELQLSYSRRINRPGQGQVNPFTDYADSLNVRKGNPQLDPEYINSLELGFFRRFGEQSLTATAYYRYTEDLISRFREVDTTSGVTTTTFVNYSSSQSYGLEIVVKNQFGKKFSATTSFNIFQNKINGSNVEAELQSDATNWNAKTAINYKLTATSYFQVTANYMAPVTNPQGTFRGMSGVDLGFRQELLKGKLTLSVSATDIFNTREFVVDNDTPQFTSEFYRKRESRVGTFTLTYRFGVAEISRKKQNRNMEQPDMNNQGDF